MESNPTCFLERATNQLAFIQLHSKLEIKTWLEIGAGSAGFSRLLRERFSKSEGHVIDSNKKWVELYKSLNIKMIDTMYPSDKVKDSTYSLIHMSHLLEHIVDLSTFLKQTKQALSPNGHLFIEVPNCTEDYWSKDVGDGPHISFFNQNALKKLLENNGFKCLACKECDNRDVLRGIFVKN